MPASMNLFVNIGARVMPSVSASVSGVEKRMAQMTQRMNRHAAEVKAVWASAERSAGRTFGGAARDFTASVSAPMAAIGTLGMRSAYQWAKVGNELQSITQMSGLARKRIEDVARAMPGSSAQNLSMALDLGRTGFNAREIEATLPTTLKLSRADNSVDPAGAADIMTNVMTGMRLYNPAMSMAQIQKNAERVANNIAIGAAQSSSDIRLMGESFKYAAPMWARAGGEIEDLTASIMTMANAGIKGSEAGVAIRSGMVRLIKPTKGAIAVMDRLGLKLDDYVTASRKPTGDAIVQSLKAQGIAADGVRAKIDALLNDPNLSGGPLIEKISSAIAEGMEGGADAADLDKISDGVANAIMAGADRVDFMKFMRDAQRKGMSLGDIVNFFDVRQGARLSTLLGGDLERSKQIVRSAVAVANGQGSFLDKMYAMQRKGPVGPWEDMQRAMSNLVISMAESGAMDAVADGMNAIANGVMALSKTSPGLLKFITLSILGIGVMAPLGFALSGIAATFRLLAFPIGLARLALGKFIPRIVSTRIAMVGARYGITAAIAEIVKSFVMLPLRAGAALGKLRGILTAARGMGAPGIGASPAGGAVLRGLSTVGPRLLALATGWGGMIVRGIVAGVAAAGGVLAGITAPMWGAIALVGAAFIAWAVIIRNKWEGVKAYFTGWFSAFAAKTAPLRQSLSQLGASLGNLGSAFMGWLGRLAAIAGEKLASFGRAVLTFFAPAIDRMKALWASIAPVVMAALAPIGAAISGIIGWVKAALAWFANLLGPAETSKWASWGNAVGGAIGGVVNRLKGLVDWVRSGINAMTDLFNRSAQTPGARPLPMPQGAGGPRVAGKRASGGPVIGGRMYLVGERGPELFHAPGSGNIIPANDTARLLTGRASGGNVVPLGGSAPGSDRASVSMGGVTINIYEATNPAATAREVERTLRRMTNRQSRRFSD